MTPPPAPGLVREYTDSGNWLFRWRSYPPLVVLAFVLVAVALDPVPAGGAAGRRIWIALGLLSGALGLVIRGWALGHVPMGTSGRGTREMRAESLNTQGLYSVVRHPLYLGNYFLWMGVPLLVGHPGVVLVCTLAFWLYYERIMMAEERYLFHGYGERFAEWAARTPSFVPRWRSWSPSPHPFSLRYCLGRDYQALYGFVAAGTAAELTRSVAAGEGWMLAPAWWAWFLTGTAVYGLLHALKRRTRILEVRDRYTDGGSVSPARAP